MSVLNKMNKFVKKLGQTANKIKLNNKLPKNLQIGRRKLKLVKQIAEGGYAFVYLVKDTETHEEFALKKALIYEDDISEAAKLEVQVMQNLGDHPNIIRFYGSQILDGSQECQELYILMEYAAGGQMLDIMSSRQHDRFTEQEIWRIFTDVCYGVAHMHSQSPPIAHRDLKVENILLGVDRRYKLCDFGSSTTRVYSMATNREAADAKLDFDKNTTMEYRAPEMVDVYSKKVVNEKVDIWALGCLLYKLAYFTTPFEQDGALQIINCRYRIPEKPKYSAALVDTIKYLLNLDPQTRPSIFDVLEKICSIQNISCNVKLPLRIAPEGTRELHSPEKASSNRPTRAVFSELDWQKGSPQINPSMTTNDISINTSGQRIQRQLSHPIINASPRSGSLNAQDSWVADFETNFPISETETNFNNNNGHFIQPTISCIGFDDNFDDWGNVKPQGGSVVASPSNSTSSTSSANLSDFKLPPPKQVTPNRSRNNTPQHSPLTSPTHSRKVPFMVSPKVAISNSTAKRVSGSFDITITSPDDCGLPPRPAGVSVGHQSRRQSVQRRESGHRRSYSDSFMCFTQVESVEGFNSDKRLMNSCID